MKRRMMNMVFWGLVSITAGVSARYAHLMESAMLVLTVVLFVFYIGTGVWSLRLMRSGWLRSDRRVSKILFYASRITSSLGWITLGRAFLPTHRIAVTIFLFFFCLLYGVYQMLRHLDETGFYPTSD